MGCKASKKKQLVTYESPINTDPKKGENWSRKIPQRNYKQKSKSVSKSFDYRRKMVKSRTFTVPSTSRSLRRYQALLNAAGQQCQEVSPSFSQSTRGEGFLSIESKTAWIPNTLCSSVFWDGERCFDSWPCVIQLHTPFSDNNWIQRRLNAELPCIGRTGWRLRCTGSLLFTCAAILHHYL